MGRCWTILEGGNRGGVLKRSAVAMTYGDLNDRGDASGGDRGSGVSGLRAVEHDGPEKVYAVLSVKRVIGARLATRGNERLSRQ